MARMKEKREKRYSRGERKMVKQRERETRERERLSLQAWQAVQRDVAQEADCSPVSASLFAYRTSGTGGRAREETEPIV